MHLPVEIWERICELGKPPNRSYLIFILEGNVHSELDVSLGIRKLTCSQEALIDFTKQQRVIYESGFTFALDVTGRESTTENWISESWKDTEHSPRVLWRRFSGADNETWDTAPQFSLYDDDYGDIYTRHTTPLGK